MSSEQIIIIVLGAIALCEAVWILIQDNRNEELECYAQRMKEERDRAIWNAEALEETNE